MESNLSIDNKLLNTTLKAGGLKTKKNTVNLALEEFVTRRKTAGFLAPFGLIEYDDGYEYKKARQRD